MGISKQGIPAKSIKLSQKQMMGIGLVIIGIVLVGIAILSW
jgi:hypothetical protein